MEHVIFIVSYDAIGSFLIGAGGVMLLVGFWTRS